MARLATYGIAIFFPLAVVGHGPCRGMTVADCQVNEGNIIHRYKSWDYHFNIIFPEDVFMLPIPQVQLQRCHLREPVQEIGPLPVLESLSEWEHAASGVSSSQDQLSPGKWTKQWGQWGQKEWTLASFRTVSPLLALLTETLTLVWKLTFAHVLPTLGRNASMLEKD